MKFLHVGDMHLGKTVCGFSMITDQEVILQEIFEMAKDNEVQAVVISGDIYDRSVPSEEAVKLLDSFIGKVQNAGIPLLMISGNHDSDERLQFGSALFERSGVHIAGRYDGNIPRVRFQDEFGAVDFHLLPFVKMSHVQHQHPDDDIKDYASAIRVALSYADLDPNARNVMVAHQFVTGKGDPELDGSEVLPISIGTVEKVGWEAFDAFDYVALGHVHRPQRIGRDTCRYAGSILKYARSEVRTAKSVCLVDMKEKGNVEITRLPLHPKRDMKEVRGTMEMLLHPADPELARNYIFAVIQGEELISGAADSLREVYPYLMNITWESTRQKSTSEIISRTAERSFDELIYDFYRRVLGEEPKEEEMVLLRHAAEEAGVIM